MCHDCLTLIGEEDVDRCKCIRPDLGKLFDCCEEQQLGQNHVYWPFATVVLLYGLSIVFADLEERTHRALLRLFCVRAILVLDEDEQVAQQCGPIEQSALFDHFGDDIACIIPYGGGRVLQTSQDASTYEFSI
jgi:hypothetical protein